ncbi:DMT family transporter [Alkalicella caledoniensis]|uniref:DMT family transporter n=1 Tax=Alkalicella caledoniensis TaxID=2731377 RepID=A0A7G9W930_ALKCA|nr:DMT family transporter [Alkalicella caledoniensis]QNO15192.1 DMT family transporter [Alkalicella caledoniensis]
MAKKTMPIHFFSGLTYATIFGFSFLFTSRVLQHIEPFHLLSFRFLLAFSVMTILKITRVIDIPLTKELLNPYLFLLALFQPLLYFTGETIGVKMTSSSESGLMIALIPILVAIFSAVFLKEYPTKKQIPFIILSTIGVSVIVLFQDSVEFGSSLLGFSMLSLAVISAAFFNILSRSLSNQLKPLQITYFMMGFGSVFFSIVAVSQHISNNSLGEFFLPLQQSEVLVGLGYLSILSSIIAFFMVNFTLSKVTASQGAVFANLVTVISIFAGVFIGKESFYLYHIVGSILIIFGVWGTNKFVLKDKGTISIEEVA